MQLYPLKFKPQIHQKNWGANRLNTQLNKDCPDSNYNGESWEISGLDDNLSVVTNGYLQDNNIEELIEIYMGELVGDKVYDKFGLQFPLLIKFIDAQKDLSIQVHPDDAMAKQEHQSYGKTEMWYVLQADEDAKITLGFSESVDKNKLSALLNNKSITDVLNVVSAKKGDIFYLPAGTVHSIGKGLLILEIQQTSDITYRLYDYDRLGLDGEKRELHTDLALQAINYKQKEQLNISHDTKLLNTPQELVTNPYFTSNILHIDKPIQKDIYELDSFVVYVCIEGELSITYNDHTEHISLGETVLVPASCREFTLTPISKKTSLLEAYIP